MAAAAETWTLSRWRGRPRQMRTCCGRPADQWRPGSRDSMGLPMPQHQKWQSCCRRVNARPGSSASLLLWLSGNPFQCCGGVLLRQLDTRRTEGTVNAASTRLVVGHSVCYRRQAHFSQCCRQQIAYVTIDDDAGMSKATCSHMLLKVLHTHPVFYSHTSQCKVLQQDD